MRKLWEMRRILLPQLCVLISMSLLIAAAPGVADTEVSQVSESDSTVITTTYKPDGDGNVTEVRTKAIVLKAPEKPVKAPAKAAAKPEPKNEYDDSVLTALNKMKLTPAHIESWIAQHPKSALKSIKGMTPAKQKNVANIASFIRSINGKLSLKTVWREAAAMVMYCDKYKISTELAVGIAKAESHFKPNVQSKAGAVGVMQVMWKVHYGMLQAKGIAATREQMFDPERGIEAGILILSRYVKAYGSVQKALNRYYGGISTAYLRKVNKNMAMLQSHSEKSGL
jgi:hypothetical protein